MTLEEVLAILNKSRSTDNPLQEPEHFKIVQIDAGESIVKFECYLN